MIDDYLWETRFDYQLAMENSADSFEYFFHLAKTLSTECRSTRQGTERIEQLIKRLTKLTQTSFEELSSEPDEDVKKKYESLKVENERDRLIRENYTLIYQIERQEYVCKRIWALIDQIEDLLESIKKFVVEQRAHRTKTERQFVEMVLKSRIMQLQTSTEGHASATRHSRTKLDFLLKELHDACQGIDWSQLPNTNDSRRLLQKVSELEDKYDFKLRNS